jgi:hypothetical protein
MTSRSRSWRRLTAGLMVPLIAVLMLQIRYYAPYHVEDINIAAPSSAEPLAITISPPPVTIAPAQLSAERPAGAHSPPAEARPLRPSPGRAPPVVAL